MSALVLNQSVLRLFAVMVMLSGLLVWGVADRLAKEHDYRFQAAGVEECSLVASHGEDSSSDGTPDNLLQALSPCPAHTGDDIAHAGFDVPRARLLGEPGLPRAPPA